MNPVRNKKSEIFADAPEASRISNGMKQGTALIYVLLTVGIMLSIAFFMASIFASKIRLSFDFSNSVAALYSADSAIEWKIYNQLKEPDANQPILENGATFNIVSPLGVLPIKVIGSFRGVSRAVEISL